MTDFNEALNTVLKYGLAPADQLNSLAEECLKGGNFDPNNTADGVLADFLGDNDDAREHIVRKDMTYRGSSISAYHKKYNEHQEKLMGTTNARWDDAEYDLPDGSKIRHSLLTGIGTDRKAAELFWDLSTPGRIHSYCAMFTPEEADHILRQLGLKEGDHA